MGQQCTPNVGVEAPTHFGAVSTTHARGAWRIVDEIYLNLSDQVPDGTVTPTILSTDPDAIVINSFSKYFGMTG